MCSLITLTRQKRLAKIELHTATPSDMIDAEPAETEIDSSSATHRKLPSSCSMQSKPLAHALVFPMHAHGPS